MAATDSDTAPHVDRVRFRAGAGELVEGSLVAVMCSALRGSLA
jgi:hypothetical protein